jgi:hypothetical protein
MIRPRSRRPEPAGLVRYRRVVGFNPFRAHAKRSTDYVIVGIALVVIAALVLWGLFG